MTKQLKFTNKNFRIMLIGDPHENSRAEALSDYNKIEDYLALQYAAVQKLSPDLVVLMGDNACASSEAELKRILLRMTKPYADYNIPFAFVLGNHDLECDVNDLFQQYNIYRQLPSCILPDSDKINSYGDYNLTVNSSDNQQTAFNLFFMYSGNKAEAKYYSYYDFIKDEQINWYENTVDELKKKNNKIIPAMLFQHIPVPEIYELLNEKSEMSLLFDGVSGQNGRRGKYFNLNKKTGVTGYMGEAPCPPEYNNGQFASWKKKGDIIAAFFGHDHMNDFAGMVDGITLGQCKLASFQAYGDGLMQGVRIVDINESSPRSIETRMVYYRDLVGKQCKSISGYTKFFRDRTSVKSEAGLKTAGLAAAVILPCISLKFITKKLHKK